MVGTAGAYMFGQYGLQVRQGGQLFAHVLKLVLGQATGFVTVRAIVEAKWFGYFVQTETQALRRFHKLHARHVRVVIAANGAIRLVGLSQQAFALVEPDGLYIDARCPGKDADGQIL